MNGRYIIFAGDRYYPNGGWEDYVGTAAELIDAYRMLADRRRSSTDWWHIVDMATLEIVATGPSQEV